MDAMITNQLQVSFPGWLPTGQKTYLTIPVGTFTPEEAFDYLLNYSQRLLARGWLLTEPGLEAGEQSYSVTHIVRGTQPAKDGKPATPIIFFYSDNGKWSDVKTWLNTPADIAEFEAWSGVKLDTMKSFPAGRLERSKDAQVDANYVIALTPSRRMIWKLNPDYTEGSKTESKREFARFDTASVPTAALTTASTQNAPISAPTTNVTNTPPSVATDPLPATIAGIPATTFDDIPSANGKSKSITDQITHVWQPGNTRTFNVTMVETRSKRSGVGVVYFLSTVENTTIYAFERDVFREAGYPVDGWNLPGFKLPFPQPIPVQAVYELTEDTRSPGVWRVLEPRTEKQKTG